jgi:hypothetical protein
VPDALPLHVVCNHHAHTMHTALHTLVERGYRRIGFYMMETIDHIVEHAWHSACLYHQQMAGNVQPELTLLTDLWREDAFEDWFRSRRLDAVVTNHTAALDWMRAVGAEVPARAGFAHLDWSEAMTSCAGVDQNTEHIGAAAVDSVVRQVQCNERGLPAFQTTAMIKGTWRDGPTVRAAGADRQAQVVRPVVAHPAASTVRGTEFHELPSRAAPTERRGGLDTQHGIDAPVDEANQNRHAGHHPPARVEPCGGLTTRYRNLAAPSPATSPPPHLSLTRTRRRPVRDAGFTQNL